MWQMWIRSDLGSMRAHEEGLSFVARLQNGQRVFSDPERWQPSITLAEAGRRREVPTSLRPPPGKGAPQYVFVHSHPWPAGTVVYVDQGTRFVAETGPSPGDIFSNWVDRNIAGRNAIDYVITPEGIYRVIGEVVQWIAPIGYLNPALK
jgi:hypothetical protein